MHCESAAKLLTKDEARPALEVRPHDENDSSRAQREQQHDAEVEFCSLPSLLSSVHLKKPQEELPLGARCSRIELADHVIIG
jgi:hypothetical protein